MKKVFVFIGIAVVAIVGVRLVIGTDAAKGNGGAGASEAKCPVDKGGSGASADGQCPKDKGGSGACADGQCSSSKGEAHAGMGGHGAAGMGGAAVGGTISGTVVDTTNASRYTYVQLDTGTEKVWVAGPTVAVKIGDKVSIRDGMPTKDFKSPSLKRTFDVIYFTTQIIPQGTNVSSTQAAVEVSPMGRSSGHKKASMSSFTYTDVKRAEGGKTVGEIWAERAALADKPVIVQGKVVKAVSAILGKNWLHLRDGTGDAGTDDVTVTTAGQAAVGDVVNAAGTVRTNMDFGSGYSYEVLLENATLTKQ